jgi:hypothetical protein
LLNPNWTSVKSLLCNSNILNSIQNLNKKLNFLNKLKFLKVWIFPSLHHWSYLECWNIVRNYKIRLFKTKLLILWLLLNFLSVLNKYYLVCMFYVTLKPISNKPLKVFKMVLMLTLLISKTLKQKQLFVNHTHSLNNLLSNIILF